jgi:hypothetical protein
LTVKRIDNESIALLGDCPSEDAEKLLQCLLESSSASVNWSECERMHTAVVQVLLASGCRLTGTPTGSFLNRYVGHALSRAGGQNQPFLVGSEVRKARQGRAPRGA